MSYFDKHFSLITGFRFLLKDIIQYLEEINANGHNKNLTLLDIGCGKQPYKKILNNYHYIGMDNHTEVQAEPKLEGSVTNIPLGNQSVDVCLSVWLLDDVIEIDKAIKEISRVLTENGLYYAIENQSTHIHNPPHDYFRFAPSALQQVCEKHQLKLIRYSSFAGDFANIGFSLILVNRTIWGILRMDKIMRPIYSLFINIIFRPLDKIFRIKQLKGKFETNSLGYYYIFKKMQ